MFAKISNTIGLSSITYGAANPIEVEEVLHPCELSTQCENDRRLRRQKQQQRPRRRKYIKSPEKPRKSMKIAPN